jgi:drug/metabolite transporter superfamily protein YnfA
MNKYLFGILPTLKRIKLFGKVGLFGGIFLLIAASMVFGIEGQMATGNELARLMAPMLVLLTALTVIGELAVSIIESYLNQQLYSSKQDVRM